MSMTTNLLIAAMLVMLVIGGGILLISRRRIWSVQFWPADGGEPSPKVHFKKKPSVYAAIDAIETANPEWAEKHRG